MDKHASHNPDCALCELSQSCQTVCMPGVGVTEDADVLFVAEAPSDSEDRAGRMLTGDAGRLLLQALAEYGIDQYRVAIVKAVRCSPPADKAPSVKQARACAPYLAADIEALKPRFIVPLGNVALKSLTGMTGVTKVVGRQIPHESGAVVFPMISPAAVLNNEAMLPVFESGFEMLARALEGKAADTTGAAFEESTLDEFIAALDRIAARKATFAVDIETEPRPEYAHFPEAVFNPKFGKMRTIAVAWADTDAERSLCVAWTRLVDLTPTQNSKFIMAMRRLLRSGAFMVAHNAPFEVKWFLHHFNIKRGEYWPVEDTLLFHYLLDENQTHGLEVVAAQYTDMGGYDNEVALLLAQGKKHHEMPIDVLGRYNAGDALATYKAWVKMRPLLRNHAGLWRAWSVGLGPSIFPVAWSELHGRKVDYNALETRRAAWKREGMESLAAVLDNDAVGEYEAARAAGDRPLKGGFNPNSAQQMGDLLFGVLGVPVAGRTEGGAASVKAEFLEPYKDKYPIIADYLNYKGRGKALEKLAEAEYYTAPDSFLYGSYMIFGTVTGRWSSANPNLQNYAKEVREIFVPRRPDWVFVEADYSQLELRLIADAAQCRVLLDAFLAGQDPHKAMAARMYGISLDDVTPEQRQRGKIANFLLSYGGGALRLCFSGGLDIMEAETTYEAFHRAAPEIKKYGRRMGHVAATVGSVRSSLGRLRRLPAASNPDWRLSGGAKREAGNAPIQADASDLNGWSFSEMSMRRLPRAGMETLALGPTHDSGLYEGPLSEVPALSSMLRTVMVEEAPRVICPKLKVPLDIDIKVGKSWGFEKPVELEEVA